jgi:hypothetical protein
MDQPAPCDDAVDEAGDVPLALEIGEDGVELRISGGGGGRRRGLSRGRNRAAGEAEQHRGSEAVHELHLHPSR